MKTDAEISARFQSLADLVLLIVGLLKILLIQSIDRATGKSDSNSLSEQRREIAIWLKNALIRRGPLYIKIGQIISTRPDMFYSEWIEEFSTLQDNAPPVQFDEIRKVIESELKKPISELFVSLQEEPIATASIAQIHKGWVLEKNELIEVAVKVQKPGVEKKILTDLRVIRSIVQHVGIFLPRLTKGTDLDGTLLELENTFGKELDYVQELNAIRRFRIYFANPKYRVVVPAEYNRLSAKRILTMRFISSTKLNQFGGSKVEIEEVIRLIIRAFLKQFFIDGDFHADPHPGNIGAKVDEKGPYLVFYDLGLNCSLPLSLRSSLSRLIGLLIDQDTEGILDECVILGLLTPEARKDADVMESIYSFIDAIPNTQVSSESLAQLRTNLLNVSEKGTIVFPAVLTFMGRVLVILEGTFRMFQETYPEIDLGSIVVSEALPILSEILGKSDNVFERATNDVQRTLNFGKSLLLTGRKTFLDIERGAVKIPVSSPLTDRSLRRLKAGVKSTNAAILGAAFFTSGIILLASGAWIVGLFLVIVSLFAFERWLFAENRMER